MVLGTGPLHGIWYLVLGTMAYGHLVQSRRYGPSMSNTICRAVACVAQRPLQTEEYMAIS